MDQIYKEFIIQLNETKSDKYKISRSPIDKESFEIEIQTDQPISNSNLIIQLSHSQEN